MHIKAAHTLGYTLWWTTLSLVPRPSHTGDKNREGLVGSGDDVHVSVTISTNRGRNGGRCVVIIHVSPNRPDFSCMH